jgi:ABC-type proline/glycine betaine transport system permease subunit
MASSPGARTGRVAVRLFLDAAQVMPAFVYLIPVLILFNVYHARAGGLGHLRRPVGIRLTSLGITRSRPRRRRRSPWRDAPPGTVEGAGAAGRSHDDARGQQVIMMSLSIGDRRRPGRSGALGLGGKASRSQYSSVLASRPDLSLLAVVLDRITQAWGRPRRPTQAVH